MTFIDKLENLLLEPSLDIYCSVKEHTSGLKAFFLSTDFNKYSDHVKKQQENKEDGIKEMISYLKDPINFKERAYTHYSLEFWDDPHGEELEQKILDLEPTDDEVIHLYQHAAFSFGFKLLNFIRMLKNKESIIKLMSVGYDAKYDYNNYAGHLRYCLYSLSDIELSDDEHANIIRNYIRNSNSIKESETEIINIITAIIIDIKKAEQLILELTGKDIEINDEVIEKKVIKLEMNDFSLIRRFGLDDAKEIAVFLNQFDMEINKNIGMLSDTLNIKYYSQQNFQNPQDDRLTHNLIIENISGNTKEVDTLLDSYHKYCYDNCSDYASLHELTNYLKENPSIFRKIILDTFMPPSASKEDKKSTKI
jgi:hypothetical protein